MFDIRYIGDNIDLWRLAPDTNAKLIRCEKWLVENVGERFVEWDFMQYGVIRIYKKDDLALIFKLKFGA